MSMLTDIFVATKADARKYEERLVREDADIDETYPRVSHQGITGIELSILLATLQQESLSGKHLFKVVSSSTDDGITEALPQKMIKTLSELSDGRIEEVSTLWSQHQAIKLSSIELAPLLVSLRSLACRATDAKKDLFVWYCP